MTTVDGITLVPEPTHERLLPRQEEAYKLHRKQLLKWSLEHRKDPENGDGYAHETVRSRAYRLDEFYRWVWEHEDGFTTNITADHATRYMREVAASDKSQSYKATVQKAIQTLFKWRNHERGDDILWDFDMTFTTGGDKYKPNNYLTRDERKQLRDVALEYGSIPH